MWYGLYSLFTYPLPVLVAFDLPRKWPNAYSAWCALATCCMGWFGIIMLYQCNFLNGGYCSGNQFLLLQFNAAVFPMLGLFAMSCGRAWIALGTCAYWALVCGLAVSRPWSLSNLLPAPLQTIKRVVVPQLPQKPAFARQVVNYLLFAIFIQWLHYSQEKIDRRMYTLRMQLKISYRAQQKAQIAEKKANNSKKRFISYIFHEVRVPLNTAYLAFQNLQAAATFDRKDEDQMVEVYALETSLQQVQQVLNDVLESVSPATVISAIPVSIGLTVSLIIKRSLSLCSTSIVCNAWMRVASSPRRNRSTSTAPSTPLLPRSRSLRRRRTSDSTSPWTSA